MKGERAAAGKVMECSGLSTLGSFLELVKAKRPLREAEVRVRLSWEGDHWAWEAADGGVDFLRGQVREAVKRLGGQAAPAARPGHEAGEGARHA